LSTFNDDADDEEPTNVFVYTN